MTLTFALGVSLASILLSAITLWFIAMRLKDNSIMDVFYGPVYAVTALLLVVVSPGEPHPVAFLLLMLILVWAMRLSVRIARKNIGKGEDPRYQAWREAWMEKGAGYFAVRSFLQVFLLQGLVIYVVLLPFTLLIGAGGGTYPLVVLLGVVVWCVGFLFEVVADHQLDVFIRNPDNHGKIMRSGLFRFSRRPNYFGESLMWWGIAIIALGSVAFPLSLIALLSPLVITYIVYTVTGPMLEARWEKNLAYQEYRQETNYFIPWFPKERKKTENQVA